MSNHQTEQFNEHQEEIKVEKTWEERLKESFYDSDGDLCPEDADYESVKNFISNLLEEKLNENT